MTETPNQYAAGLLRGAGAGAMYVNKGGVQYLLIPRETLERALAVLEGWDYYAETSGGQWQPREPDEKEETP